MKQTLKNNFPKPIVYNDASLIATRFEELFLKMPMACFTFNSGGTIQQWNGLAERMLELSAKKEQSTTSWYTPASSLDGLWSLEFVHDVFRGIPIAGREWSFRTAITERHLVCEVFPVRGRSGKIIGAISANLDITDRKVAEMLAKLQLVQLSQITSDLELRRMALERVNLQLRKHTSDGWLAAFWK